MRGSLKKKLMVSGIFFILFLTIYIGIAFFYMSGFTFGTWINGVYCTGKTITDANQILTEQYIYDGCTIVFLNHKMESFTQTDAVTTFDFTNQLQEIQEKQNSFFWIQNVIHFVNLLDQSTTEPDILVDEASFKEWFYQLPEVKEQEKTDLHVKIVKTQNDGYILDDTKWNVLDIDKAYTECLTQIENHASKIVLKDLDCYYNETPTDTEEQTINLYDQLNQFLNFQITYDMGDEQIILGHADLSNFVAVGENETDFIYDKDGNFTWDQDKIENYISNLAEQFDTYNTTRSFQTTRGDIVSISGGTYGNQINQKTEIAYLEEALGKHETTTHIPSYKKEAYVRGKNDIGNTYIEIDLTNQELYCYIAGNCEIATPIVTGNMMLHRDTPEGVYYIYAKQRNRILRGNGYAAHVNYWMPIVNGIGIHDALWRDEFGGTIYETDGSHGCINTPYDAMTELYDLAEIGMPVVLYQ